MQCILHYVSINNRRLYYSCSGHLPTFDHLTAQLLTAHSLGEPGVGLTGACVVGAPRVARLARAVRQARGADGSQRHCQNEAASHQSHTRVKQSEQTTQAIQQISLLALIVFHNQFSMRFTMGYTLTRLVSISYYLGTTWYNISYHVFKTLPLI